MQLSSVHVGDWEEATHLSQVRDICGQEESFHLQESFLSLSRSQKGQRFQDAWREEKRERILDENSSGLC